MTIPKEHSTYRASIYQKYGSKVTKELEQIKDKEEYFLIKDIAGKGTIKCFAHMADRTRSQYLSDICAELQMRGVLGRNGKTYYFVTKRKRTKKEIN